MNVSQIIFLRKAWGELEIRNEQKHGNYVVQAFPSITSTSCDQFAIDLETKEYCEATFRKLVVRISNRQMFGKPAT